MKAFLFLSVSFLYSLHASAAPLFSESFNSGDPCYGMSCVSNASTDRQIPVGGEDCGFFTWSSGKKYCFEHFADKGWLSSGAPHMVMRKATESFNIGWTFPESKSSNWIIGDTVVFRFRIRYDAAFRWDGADSQQHRIIDFGAGVFADPHQITIMNEKGANSAANCTPLSSSASGMSCTDSSGTACSADTDCLTGYHCLPNDYDSNHGGFSVKAGLISPCVGPVKMTYDTWYHVQVEIKSSNSSDGFIKLWVNNNDMSAPDAELTGINYNVGKWQDGTGKLGQFWNDQNASRDQGFIMDDFELDTALDDSWFPTNNNGVPICDPTDTTCKNNLPGGSSGGSGSCRTIGIFSLTLLAGLAATWFVRRRKLDDQ